MQIIMNAKYPTSEYFTARKMPNDLSKLQSAFPGGGSTRSWRKVARAGGSVQAVPRDEIATSDT